MKFENSQVNSKFGKVPDCSDWYAEERERDEEEQREPGQARREQQIRRQPRMTVEEKLPMRPS